MRLVVPKRYAWKSAKWLKAIEIHQFDRPGFWEVRVYHNQADPWLEQPFLDEALLTLAYSRYFYSYWRLMTKDSCAINF